MSNYNPVNKSCGDRGDCRGGGGHHDHDHANCKPKKVIFKCKETCGTNKVLNGSYASLQEELDLNKLTSDSFILDKASLDKLRGFGGGGHSVKEEIELGTIVARDLDCFKKPCVKIETSAIITASSNYYYAMISLKYQLLRRCEHENEFKVIKEIDIPKTELFYYLDKSLTIPSFCDCEETCKKKSCCEYKVVVKVENSGYPVNLNISTGTISLIASEESC